MKTKRNLSGIYFRSFDTETDKWDNRCFEDLSTEEQDKQMENRDVDWHKRMIKILANILNEIGEQLDIVKE